MNKFRIAAAVAVLALFAALSSYGQTVTGSITGTVADPSGAVVGGAKVTLTNELTNQSREQDTGVSGDFAFTEIVPGTYDITITKDGFKSYAQRAIVVATSENVALHQISMEIGAVNQEVTVSASAARIETDNGERTGLVSATQMDTMPNSGLNYLTTLQVLPGVTQEGNTTAIAGGRIGQAVVQLDGIGFEDNGVQGTGGNYTPNLEAIGEIKVMLSNYDAEYGTRSGGQINVSSKSGTNQFHGSGYWYGRNTWFDSRNYFNPARALDRFNNPGYTIGGPIFIPGTNFDKSRNKLFFFWAQEWLPSTSGGTPQYLRLPTAAERKGDFSNDVTGCTNGANCGVYLGANFGAPSQSAGPLISIHCPDATGALTATQAANVGTACGSAINSQVVSYMNTLFPLPNNCATAIVGGINQCNSNKANDDYITTSHTTHNQEQARIDYAINPTTTFFVRGIRDYSLPVTGVDKGQLCAVSGQNGCNWPDAPTYGLTVSYGLVGTLTHTFTPNLVNDLTAGFNLNFQNFAIPQSQLTAISAGSLGLTGANALPEFLTSVNNTFNVALPPYAFFNDSQIGTTPSFLGADLRYPFIGRQDVRNLTDNLSWVHGQHSFKGGIYLELGRRYGKRESYFNGAYSFANDTTDPDNTNFGYANALLGVITDIGGSSGPNPNGAVPVNGGYDQSAERVASHGRYHDIEWYLQDDWKVTRRLSINPGIRFQHITPTWSQGDVQNNWLPNLYPSSGVNALIVPGCKIATAVGTACPAIDRVGINPNNSNAQVSPGLIGDYAPTAAGTYVGTIFPGTKAFPASTAAIAQPGLGLGPRIGFAYDMFGDGKTALRGGFGMFNNRPIGDDFFNQLMTQPPAFLTYTSSDTNVAALQALCTPSCNASSLYLAPLSLQAYQSNWHLPQSYSWSFGIQHDLGDGFLLDVAYQGNVGRHLNETQNINATTYGSFVPGNPNFNCLEYDPSALNGTNGCTSTPPATTPLITGAYADIVRPYANDGAITYTSFDGNTNYHSLQTQIQRRFSKRLTFTGTWTWSKVMDFGTTYGPDFCTARVLAEMPASKCVPLHRDYGPASTYRKHNVVVNWTYNVPNASQRWDNVFVRETLDGWQIAGLYTLTAGAPIVVNYSIAGVNVPGALSTDALVTAPNLSPSCTGRLQRHLNVGCFSLPAFANVGSPTSTPAVAFSGLGNANLRDLFNGPWLNNWNISVFKHFALGKSETRSLELRMETYNTWNHTQMSGFGSTTLQYTYTASTGATALNDAANNNFLQYTSAQAPRTMQAAIRLLF